jgi:omega-amidase
MLIHGVQMAAVWERPEKTLDLAESWVKEASSAGGELVCFAEQFATGWDPSSHNHVQERDGPIVGGLKALAREYGIAILGSFREKHDPLPRNTCIVVDGEGHELASYSKCHLFSPGGEDRYFAPGQSPAIFELHGTRFGIAICYDLRFGILFHYYASVGVDVMLVPAAWPASRMDHWQLFIRARALEGQAYVIGINTTGRTPVDVYCGGSMAAGPAGEIVSGLGEEEGLLAVKCDRASLEAARRSLPVSRDRRPDLYQRLIKEPDNAG